MELIDFKKHIQHFPQGHIFKFGITEPFSWRGSYDEVAFSIIESPATREEILAKIDLAYSETFFGYKGGEYRYSDYTTVNFEEYGCDNYSDGKYTSQMIAKIEGGISYQSQEHRLISMAFS